MNKNKKSPYLFSMRTPGYGLQPNTISGAAGFSQEAPRAAGSGFAQETPSSSGFAQETPSYSGFAQETPSYSGFAQEAPSSSGFAQEAPSYSGFAQEAPSYSGFAQETPSYLGFAQEAPSYLGFAQEAPSSSGFAQEINYTSAQQRKYQAEKQEKKRLKNEKNAANQPAVDKFRALLPKVQDKDELLSELEYFVILKNGKRVPIDTVCEEVEKDPENTVFRSADDRLVLVIEALKKGALYWRQAFYLSTGESSRMANTWLPFSGIHYMIIKGNDEKVDQVFEKNEYAGDPVPINLTNNPRYEPLPIKQINEFSKVFGYTFLPEGPQTYRFGPISYYYASYKMGGDNFNNFMYNSSSRFMTELSPLKSCFKDPKKFPMVSAKVINEFIHKYEALPIYNLFRHLGIKQAGLQNIINQSRPIKEILFLNRYSSNTKTKKINYKIPSKDLYSTLRSYLRDLYIQHLLGTISEEELKAKVAEKNLKKIREFVGKSGNYPTEPAQLISIIGHENAYGGKRKKTIKKRRKQTK